ncbi:MAG: 4Fe-4S binding protein [Anaerolineae bacterium]|nr:4Fe-4S binding protein [Anaerolineae bacterium]
MALSRWRFDLLLKLWPLGKVLNLLGNLPLVGSLFDRYFRAEENEAIIIPIRQAIQNTQSVVLPFALLAPLVERASARTILNMCLCRHAEGCRGYPSDIGCLFLGDGAARIRRELGRPASIAEALDHIEHAMIAGLMPTVLHSAFDAYLLDIPYQRMLAICFCCDCCCTVRYGLRVGPAAFRDTVVCLPGLSVQVSAACTNCGTCSSVCPVGAISMRQECAHIDQGRCKGCGRCATVCPAGAIQLCAASGDGVLEGLLERISRRTDIGSSGQVFAS